MVGFDPTTQKAHGLSTTPLVKESVGVLVRFTTCKRLTNSLPYLTQNNPHNTSAWLYVPLVCDCRCVCVAHHGSLLSRTLLLRLPKQESRFDRGLQQSITTDKEAKADVLIVMAIRYFMTSNNRDQKSASYRLLLYDNETPGAPPVFSLCVIFSSTWYDTFFFSFFFFARFYFPASGQAVVTGVVPSPPWFLPLL